MPSEKVVVSIEEIESVLPEENATQTTFKQLPPPIPLWAKIAMAPLVLVLPLLCVVAIVLKIAFRAQPPRIRYALVTFLSVLLIVSGLLTTVATVLVASFVPVPAIINTGLPNLDEQTDFPVLNTGDTLSSADISRRLKPLVIVVSPAIKLWNRQEIASRSFGAGVLLEATHDGYLFVTANHVASHNPVRDGGSPPHIMVATATGLWSNADVIASAAPLDLALLWVPRHSGNASFVQPIAEAADGEDIFVIGHPEGLKYTLSTGIVSGLREEGIQISAAISPGNSGGPVYDSHGQLIGVVSSKFDRNRDANAENLGFAARADLLRDVARWSFYGGGRQRLETYLNDLQKMQSASPVIGKQPEATTGKE
jgi:S1-C subfamily serine protease